MTDVRLDSAWSGFQTILESSPPHQASQVLRALQVPDDLVEALLNRHELEAQRVLELRAPLALGREHSARWYTGSRSTDKNWPKLEAKLQRSLGSASTKKIDEASDKVVAMLDHPATPQFSSRGLVVGHVQSGKTSNFTSVICKAADRGYRMFIVLSGIHNSLRRQTQSRLVRDVVMSNPTLWHQITTPEHDFVPPANAASLLASKDQSLLLVVKKNAVVLKKLRRWLDSARPQLANVPTLIIDDEADQATVATRTINPLLSGIMDALPCACYVGYTATPFANLLIDPGDERDFYPRDFVVSLERGEDYQGAEKLFGRSPLDGEDPEDLPGGLDMIRVIPDDELSGLRPDRRAGVPTFSPSVTPSLRRACLWFWLATATRKVRTGADQHSSMLVHAHSDTRVHDSYAAPLEALRYEIAEGLRTSDAELRRELEVLWAEETAAVPATELHEQPVSFEAAADLLGDVVDATRVVLDHYRSNDRLDYDSGPVTVIAVGGNTLSRGLTLEGLVVSVFVRASDVYDTLLQMGRWFGYRPGYTDLPRIWMPQEMREWFAHLATVEAEMRQEIDRYLTEHKSPLELAVRIRAHPKMRVTAPAKMTSAVRAAASYGGQLVETRYFLTAPEERAVPWLRRNAEAVEELLVAVGRHGSRHQSDPTSGRLLWEGVPVDDVMRFIRSYNFHERSADADADLMTQYIDRRVASGGLRTWSVAVMGKPLQEGVPSVVLPDRSEVAVVTRSRLSSSEDAPVADIKTLSGSRDEAVDLALPPGLIASRANLATLRVRQRPESGLVLLYPIDGLSEPRQPDRRPLAAPIDVVWGVALVFAHPSGGSDVAVEYDYVSADLSKAFPAAVSDDDVDVDILNQDLDVAGATT